MLRKTADSRLLIIALDHRDAHYVKQKPEPVRVRVFNLAATYSRGSYTATTIGKAAFDGRVRNGIGSVHSFMTTKILVKRLKQ